MKLTLLDSEIRSGMYGYEFAWNDFQNNLVTAFKVSYDELDALELGEALGTLDRVSDTQLALDLKYPK